MITMKRTTTGLRLEEGKQEKLEEIARPYHSNPSALIRLAVDQLIIATEANGGQLPEPLMLRLEREYPEKAAALAALSGGDR